MLKKLLAIVITLAIISVTINDVSRFATAKRRLGNATYELARWGADRIQIQDRDTAAEQIPAMAQPLDVVVYQYDQNENTAKVWARTDVDGTIVLGTIMNLIKGMSFDKARTTPWTINEYREAGA